MSERFHDIDFMITSDGDLVLDSDGDIAVVQDDKYVEQCAYTRLRSVASDWYYDNVGADIDASIGQPNTRETADALSARIHDAFTRDNFCEDDDIEIKITPVSSADVLIGVFLITEFQATPMLFMVELNYLTGFEVKRLQ